MQIGSLDTVAPDFCGLISKTFELEGVSVTHVTFDAGANGQTISRLPTAARVAFYRTSHWCFLGRFVFP